MQVEKKIGLFGVPFDPTVSNEEFLIKLSYLQAKMAGKIIHPDYLDPYDYLTKDLPPSLLGKIFLAGKVQIPTWLQPKPTIADLSKVNLSSFSNFVESGGCIKVAEKVYNFIVDKVFPRIPGMIGVDHSSTYGAVVSIKRKCPKEKLALIVLDSHFDAVPAKIRKGLFEYAKRAKIPFITYGQSLQESFNSTLLQNLGGDQLDAENFLLYILNRKIVDAENLLVIGISDYPSEFLEKIDDPAVKEYVNFFRILEWAGVKFVPKSSLNRNGNSKRLIEEALKGLTAKKVYVSMDIDLGALSCVYAARFLNVRGLSREQIYDIFQSLSCHFPGELTLCGFDLMEIDVHKLGAEIDGLHKDQTWDICRMFLNFIGKISAS
ncbi:MAG: arginase family protein [Candidatus Bathyarchaeia archaeon]